MVGLPEEGEGEMPPPRALERGHSVRQYPTHVPDPLSSFAHAVWRFLLRRAAGRYAEHDLSDGIGAKIQKFLKMRN